MKIGGHVSIAGGFDKCIDRAVVIGANCLQTFASSPRSLKTTEFSDEIIERYLSKRKKHKIGSHFFHGPYLINLASEKPEYVKACIDTLIFYQKFAFQIGGRGTIFHIGSHKGVGFSNVKDQVASAIVEVLKKTPSNVKLYLENAAGHKGVIGADFDELGFLISSVPGNLRSKLAVCLDTQHAFASGYDVRNKSGVDEMLIDFEKKIGFKYLEVLHANDSKTEFASNRDRHENIGDGHIGLKGFKILLNHNKLKKLPFLLEVPGENKSGPRKEDVEKIRSLVK
jgi:deoxyribonuclease-4